MKKYIKAVKFFNKIADEVGGYVDTSSCSFEVAQGCITAYYDRMFDLDGEDEILEFSEIISNCSAFEILPTDKDGVCIDCKIPDIYVFD